MREALTPGGIVVEFKLLRVNYNQIQIPAVHSLFSANNLIWTAGVCV